MTDYPRIMRHDPARSHLLQLGIFYGFKGVGGPFCDASAKVHRPAEAGEMAA